VDVNSLTGSSVRIYWQAPGMESLARTHARDRLADSLSFVGFGFAESFGSQITNYYLKLSAGNALVGAYVVRF
jgi:hypothetical protein